MTGGSGSGDTGGRSSLVAVLSRWETSPPFCFSFTEGTSPKKSNLALAALHSLHLEFGEFLPWYRSCK